MTPTPSFKITVPKPVWSFMQVSIFLKLQKRVVQMPRRMWLVRKERVDETEMRQKEKKNSADSDTFLLHLQCGADVSGKQKRKKYCQYSI